MAYSTNLLLLLNLLGTGSSGLLLALALLQERLRHQDLVLGRDGAVKPNQATGQYSPSKTEVKRTSPRARTAAYSATFSN